MSIPSKTEHERRERSEAMAREREVERLPLSDRKFAREEMHDVIANRPKVVGERIGWLLDGNYGYGAMVLAREIADNKRMNRQAGLLALVGIHEWSCPRKFTFEAWKKLDELQKINLELEIRKAIESYENDTEK